MASKRRFQLILVKPSHYNDDGYVIRWWRALIPSNSLAAVYGLALDSAKRHVLGENVEIAIFLGTTIPFLFYLLLAPRRRPWYRRRRLSDPDP